MARRGPEGVGPEILLFFFFFRHTVHSLFSLLGVLSWNFERWGAQMHVWVSGCCVKPTASGPNPSGPPSKDGFDVDNSGSRGTKK